MTYNVFSGTLNPTHFTSAEANIYSQSVSRSFPLPRLCGFLIREYIFRAGVGEAQGVRSRWCRKITEKGALKFSKMDDYRWLRGDSRPSAMSSFDRLFCLLNKFFKSEVLETYVFPTPVREIYDASSG